MKQTRGLSRSLQSSTTFLKLMLPRPEECLVDGFCRASTLTD